MTGQVAWTTPADPGFAAVAALFDEYRTHYGEPPDVEATLAWLTGQVTAGRLRVAAAADLGFVTTAVLPASLTLGEAWLVRDLYVPARARRRGVARALLTHVVEAARAAGARRVSLQTETGNAPALALYAAAGFRPVTGLEMLNLPLG
ncbi:GNAT family N-acetyltransferase [Actinoplanes sp. M2I2]|uniref:GNAT family N-acetyltransferase n=1 Tax=Actinoplanes sp. M2I2 TaxID=1734444 RepID=UPI00201FE76C|nr:GNAT family N-acetyltransferase [Actinoplanes sp. M2I2]